MFWRTHTRMRKENTSRPRSQRGRRRKQEDGKNKRIHSWNEMWLDWMRFDRVFSVKHITLGDDDDGIIVNSKRTARSDRTIIYREMCTNQTSQPASQSTIAAAAAVAAVSTTKLHMYFKCCPLLVRSFVRFVYSLRDLRLQWKMCIFFSSARQRKAWCWCTADEPFLIRSWMYLSSSLRWLTCFAARWRCSGSFRCVRVLVYVCDEPSTFHLTCVWVLFSRFHRIAAQLTHKRRTTFLCWRKMDGAVENSVFVCLSNTREKQMEKQ